MILLLFLSICISISHAKDIGQPENVESHHESFFYDARDTVHQPHLTPKKKTAFCWIKAVLPKLPPSASNPGFWYGAEAYHAFVKEGPKNDET